MSTNVCIFFPERKLGGGPYYLMRLARELAKDDNYKVFYIDYPDGFAKTIPEAKDCNITFIDWNNDEAKCFFQEECILFAPIYRIDILPLINPNSKVLFFNWHTLCIPELERINRFNKQDLTEFLLLVASNNAQVFCDASHWQYCNKYTNINFNQQYVPVISTSKNNILITKKISKDKIDIALLGRLVKDKIYALNNVINCANKYTTDKKIIFHVIGDGPDKKLITTNYNNNIEIHFCGVLKNEELDNYLKEKCDVMFAMGTSVLDSASIKLPSVIIPTEMFSFECDKFVFLHETKKYVIGYTPEQCNFDEIKYRTFEEIINILCKDENAKTKIGQMCYEYTVRKHSAKKSAEQLKNYLNNTKLRFYDVNMLKKYQVLKIQTENTSLDIKQTKTKIKNKFRIAIWKKYKKYSDDMILFKKKHPIEYKLWVEANTVLKSRGLLNKNEK